MQSGGFNLSNVTSELEPKPSKNIAHVFYSYNAWASEKACDTLACIILESLLF